ncbi:hypothetical protein H4R18_000964 [Coemansia javaensis]|uniref:Zinc finger PHD-type domain-containing protein n=1 Tax=Coemansia javaensis TaxID=2761396 RepID=A0A9W8HJI4_9FUNG|nr:hypothetical protein H4R18_000964 [Coemansia javaensis]
MPRIGGGLRAPRLRDTRAFAQLSQLLHTFHADLGLDGPVDLERLEAELGGVGDDVGAAAGRVLAGALAVVDGRRPAAAALATQVRRAWARHGAGEPPAGLREHGFGALGSGDRVRVVLETCELALQHAGRLRANAGAAQWRAAPAGRDDAGRVYWVLCATRLYRQTPAGLDPGPGPGHVLPPQHAMREADGELWELLCADARDWRAVCAAVAAARAQTRHGRALAAALARAQPLALEALARAPKPQPQLQAQPPQLHLRLRERPQRAAAHHHHHGQRPLQPQPQPQPAAAGPGRSAAGARSLRAQRREQARYEERLRRDAAEAASGASDGASSQSGGGDGDDGGDDDDDDDDDDDSDVSDGNNNHRQDHSDDSWMFACLCGVRGQNYDDGRAMTACERCAVWQHLGCALRAEARRIGRPIDEDDWASVAYVCPGCRSAA